MCLYIPSYVYLEAIAYLGQILVLLLLQREVKNYHFSPVGKSLDQDPDLDPQGSA